MKYLILIEIIFLFGYSLIKAEIPISPNRLNEKGNKEGQWTVLKDKNFFDTNDTLKAQYYRIINYINGKPDGLVKDYYITGELQGESKLLSENPDVNDGKIKIYFKNGKENITDLAAEEYKKKNYQKALDIILSIEEESKGFYGEQSPEFGYLQYFKGLCYANFDALKSLDCVLYSYKILANKDSVNIQILNDIETVLFGADRAKYNNKTEAVKMIVSVLFQNKKTLALSWYIKLLVFIAESEQNIIDIEYYKSYSLAGSMAYFLNDYDSSEKYFAKAIDIIKLTNMYQDKIELMKDLAGYNHILGNLKKGMLMYDEAEIYYKESIQIYYNLKYDNSIEISNVYNNFALMYQNQRRFFDAETLFIRSLEITKNQNPVNEGKLETSYYNLGTLYLAMNRFEDAEKFLKKSLETGKNLYKGDNENIVGSLVNLANLYHTICKYDDAEMYLNEALLMSKRLNNQDNLDIATIYNNLASLYKDLNENLKADTLYRESLRIRKLFNKNDNFELAISLDNLGLLDIELGKYKEAENFLNEALMMRKRLFGDTHTEVIKSINNLALLYQKQSNYKKAESTYLEAYNLVKKINAPTSLDDITLLDNIGSLYREINDFDKAEEYYLKSLALKKQLVNGDHQSITISLNNLGLIYQSLGNFSKAESLFIQSNEMIKRLYKNDTPDLEITINNLAELYNDLGKYNEAESLLLQAISINRKLFKSEHENLARSIGNLASFYDEMGRFDLSDKLENESYIMHKKIFTYDNPNLAISLNKMAFVLKKQGKIEESEKLFIESLQMNKRLFEGDHESIAICLNNLASFYKDLKEYEKAEPLYIEALEMNKRLYKTDNITIANSLNNLATFYYAINKHEQSEILQNESIEMYKKIFPEGHLSLANSLFGLAILYNQINKYEISEKYFNQSLQMFENLVEKNNIYLSENEKDQFWNMLRQHYIDFQSYNIKCVPENQSITQTAYNNLLFSKSMLLSSNIQTRKKILESGNKIAIELFNEWTALKSNIIRTYSYTPQDLTDKKINIELLEKRANELEKQLSKISSEFAKASEKKIYDWTDIQNVLKSDVAAIEFVRFPLIDGHRYTDTICYAAYIITKDCKYPKYVLLTDGKRIEADLFTNYSSMFTPTSKGIYSSGKNPTFYKEIWQPIKDQIGDVKKVYISADGILNKMNFNVFYNAEKNDFLIDEIEIVNLTSTRELIEENNSKNSGVIALYGHPRYDMSLEQQTKLAGQYTKPTDYTELRTSPDELRSTKLKDLPATEAEVNNIAEQCKKFGIKADVKTDSAAMEEAVKSVKKPRVLHIATHGYFLSTEQIEERSKDLFASRQVFGIDAQKAIKNPLLRAGLFLSGSQNALNGQTPTNIDNGILTAEEASQLELNGTELVVLSACETGLGEVRNGEGVYGLQRAFKTAGAENILMSLCKVPDEQTKELMSTFYTNWLSGNSKRTAFRETQQSLRAKYPEPIYWGGFIMIGK